MEIFGFLLFLVLAVIPIVIIADMCGAWNSSERIEKNMEYDPNPVHGEQRFATPEEQRRAGL